MRIMFVIPRMNSGGAERMVANLSSFLCADNEVRIVTLVFGESYYKLDEKIEFCSAGFKINRKNFLTTFIDYAKFFGVARKFIEENIDRFKPDCVISFLVETDILTYLATRKYRSVVKIFSERNDPTRRNIFKQLILKKVYKHADLFICQSKKVYDYYSCVPDAKKTILPNMLDEHIIPRPELIEKTHNIVSIGRLCRQKNFVLLINAFIRSIDKLPEDCDLIIYGDGPSRAELQNLIDSNNMMDRIKLAGKSKRVLDDIKGAAMFIVSSDYEGFPNVLLEAMAIGLPVISTDFYTDTAKELIGGENGLLVPVGDVEAMSNAILTLAKDDERRKKMREVNSEVRKKYAAATVGSAWGDKIYNAVRGVDG